MASSAPLTGLRAAVSLIALAATAQALPHKRESAPYTRQGCFVSKTTDGQRLLNSGSYSGDAMTVASCAAFCSDHKYFGLEYGRECYCADSFSASPVDDSECSFPCSGNTAEKCGAGNRLDVYTNNLYSPLVPATLETPYLGCFVDEGLRALPENLLGADDMTAEKCAAHCSDYSYFGVEYGRECWCANLPPNTPAAESECSFACAGDASRLCGASGRINVWGPPVPSPPTVGDYAYLGCFTDQNDQRSLRGTVIRDSAMTLEKCAAACAAYTYFGVEFGSQCYCGVTLAERAAQVPQAECAMRCGGDSANVCGGADRLNVFTSVDCKPDPTNVPAVAGFAYQSCWADNVAGRVLTGKELRGDDMTVEKCAAFCQGFRYFGLEYASECYCGDELAGEVAPEDQCSQLCSGDALQWCGAQERLNIYAVDAAPTFTITDAPLPTVTVTLPGPEPTTV
jgi:hypothetical protein